MSTVGACDGSQGYPGLRQRVFSDCGVHPYRDLYRSVLIALRFREIHAGVKRTRADVSCGTFPAKTIIGASRISSRRGSFVGLMCPWVCSRGGGMSNCSTGGSMANQVPWADDLTLQNLYLDTEPIYIPCHFTRHISIGLSADPWGNTCVNRNNGLSTPAGRG